MTASTFHVEVPLQKRRSAREVQKVDAPRAVVDSAVNPRNDSSFGEVATWPKVQTQEAGQGVTSLIDETTEDAEVV